MNKNIPSIEELNEFAASTVREVDCGANTYMICVEKTTEKGYDEYCNLVCNSGFEKILSRKAEGNIFTTFVRGEEYIYVYYTKYSEQMRVVSGPLNSLVKEEYIANSSETFTPYIAFIPQPSDGNGFIIRLPDGRFLIADGGYRGNDRVYKTLRELEEGEIIIAGWFISHPHGDHYPAFIDFIRDHGNDPSIKLERVICNYAHHEMYNIVGTAGVENNGREVIALYEAVEQYAPYLTVMKAHTGQVIDYGSATVEVLYTIEDLLPEKLHNINNSSMVIRVNMGEHKIMLLGDTCYDSAPIMINIWGEYLRSDIMQVAHHGIWPSIKELYDAVQGEVAIFPAARSNLREYIRPEKRWAASIEAILKYAKDIYASCDEMAVLTLPYSIKSNKDALLEELK